MSLDYTAPMRAFQQGTADGRARMDENARRSAGHAFANGDYDTASEVLAGRGLIEEAARVSELARRQTALATQRHVGGLIADATQRRRQAGSGGGLVPSSPTEGGLIASPGREAPPLTAKPAAAPLAGRGRARAGEEEPEDDALSEAQAEALRQGDFDTATKVGAFVDGLSARRRTQLQRSAEALAKVLAPARSLPYEQRKAYIATHADDLRAAGYTEEQISGYDPTDANVDRAIAEVLPLSEYLGGKRQELQYAAQRENLAADNARQERQLRETERHNRAAEGLDAQRESRLAAVQDRVKTMGAVIAPILEKQRLGQALTQADQAAIDTYKELRATVDPMAALFAAPPAATGRASQVRSAGAAPRDAKQRRANTVYDTPKGPLKWTGTGWVNP